MKNKKGFTLVELLTVIVILAIIIAIAIPSIISISHKAKNNMYNTKIDTIEGSAVLYGQKNPEMIGQDITIQDLVDNGFLKADNDEGDVLDPRDNSKMNSKKVHLSKENNRIVAKYEDEKVSTGSSGGSGSDSGSGSNNDAEQTNYIASIGTKKYTTLKSAFEEAKANDTITLLNNTNEEIINTKNLKLDLGSKTFDGSFTNQGIIDVSNGTIGTSSDSTFENTGTITLNSGSTINTSTLLNTNGIININGGSLNSTLINSDGTVTMTSGFLFFIYNKGTSAKFNATGGEINDIYNKSTDVSVLNFKGEVNIKNTKFSDNLNHRTSVINDGGNVTLTNLNINSKVGINNVNENSILTLNSVTIMAQSQAISNNKGKLTINNCSITSNGEGLSYNYGTLIFNSGSIIAKNGIGIGNVSSTSIATINSGSIISNSYYALGNNGTMTINGGLVMSTKQAAVTGSGTFNFNGGKIKGVGSVFEYVGTIKYSTTSSLQSTTETSGGITYQVNYIN